MSAASGQRTLQRRDAECREAYSKLLAGMAEGPVHVACSLWRLSVIVGCMVGRCVVHLLVGFGIGAATIRIGF